MTEIKERKCPKCGEMIDSLKLWEQTQLMKLPHIEVREGKSHVEWEWRDSCPQDKGIEDDFECPSCCAVLFHDWEQANAWLLKPDGKTQPLKCPNRFYPVLRVHREDIKAQFEDHPELQEAADYIEDWQVGRIASKIGDVLMQGGDYHYGIEVWAKDYLEEAYEKNKEEIDKTLEDIMMKKAREQFLELYNNYKDFKVNIKASFEVEGIWYCLEHDKDWLTDEQIKNEDFKIIKSTEHNEEEK